MECLGSLQLASPVLNLQSNRKDILVQTLLESLSRWLMRRLESQYGATQTAQPEAEAQLVQTKLTRAWQAYVVKSDALWV